MTAHKILIVEDEGIAALSLKESLETLGFQVTGMAANSQEALLSVEETLPDLVLMDIHLDEKQEGIAIGKRLMQEYGVPVVFLTAYADPATIAKAKEIFPYGYMLKPYREADLLAGVEMAIYKHLADRREKELQQTKNKLYSLIAHDLRSPLAALSVTTRTLLKRKKSISAEDLDEFIEDIDHTVGNLFNFTENLLEWATIQSGRLHIQPESVALLPLVQEVQGLLAKQAYNKQINIQLQISPALVVTTDKNMLRSVLMNLLSNSIKFSHAGGLVQVLASVAAGVAEIKVTDEGVGMGTEHLQGLLDFKTAMHTPGTREEKGTGFGLLLCKEFIEANKGRLSISSRPGSGTEVYFTLPVQPIA